jgi:hypothetical protein
MARQLERRISRLEINRISPPADLPMLIVCESGESQEAAILRVCGPQGLPERAPEDGPHLIIVPVASPARGKSGIAVDDNEVSVPYHPDQSSTHLQT